MRQNIKSVREKRTPKITQEELAKACGWTKSRISDYERDIKIPGLNSCDLMIGAFDELGVTTNRSELFPPESFTEEASQ